MGNNPFNENVVYANDPEGLIIPYKLCGRTDLEIMTAKYNRLRKASHGLFIRLGIPERGAG